MREFDPNAPVIVGVGESSKQAMGVASTTPVDLAGAAISAALADSGQAAKLSTLVDCLAAIRTFTDSGLSFGTGSPDNVPEAYAKAAGLAPNKLIYADVGGQTPQALVNELAGALQRGEITAAVIAGGEAIGSAKAARKQGLELDWSIPSDRQFDNRLSDYPILSFAEIRHGIMSMPLAYSLIENARRIQRGQSVAQYQRDMAALWSAFASQSLSRAHAQFAKHYSEDDLCSDTGGNYALTNIYRRWMVAQDAVDIGAACIITTAGKARELGIAADKMIWLAGSAEAAEPPYSERANLSGSAAQTYAVDAALQQAAITKDTLGPIDIYSCFPCAVFAAVDTMDMPTRALGDYTLTGGLTFFGGPGNGYAMHSIVAIVEQLRQVGGHGLITANGGVMSKQATGVYSATQPNQPWPGHALKAYEAASVTLDDKPAGKAKVITHVRPETPMGSGMATLLVELENGNRALAVLEGAETANLDHAIVSVTAGEHAHKATLAE